MKSREERGLETQHIVRAGGEEEGGGGGRRDGGLLGFLDGYAPRLITTQLSRLDERGEV